MYKLLISCRDADGKWITLMQACAIRRN